MKRGIPLSVRILLWCVLNLLLLAAVFWALFRGQLGLGLDSLLTGRAGDRLQATADVLAGELSRTPQSDWDDVIARTATAYAVRLSLVKMDGSWWAGERLELPEEVRKRMADPRFGNRPRGNPAFDPRPGNRRGPALPDGQPNGGFERDGFSRPAAGPPEGQLEAREGPPAHWNGPRGERPRLGPQGQAGFRQGPPAVRPRFLIHAGNPPQYWAGVPVGGLGLEGTRGGPAMLLAVSDSLTAGGWLIDPAPWLMAGFGAVLLSLLLWYPLVRGITKSIRAMTIATERIAEGNFNVVAKVNRSDELGRLAFAINHLAGRLEHFVKGQRRFLGDIAHELNSPLARMQLGTSLLERGGDAAHQERVADVREEVEVMIQLVNELLTFSKAGLQSRDIPLETVPLAGLARRVAVRETGVDDAVEIDIPETLTALAEPELLSRAVSNLVRNALRYAGQAGPVRIIGRVEQDGVSLVVSDSGPGVPEAELERIFEPFFRPDTARTRETGGSGLGLAIVRSCVQACQGTVTAANRLPTGLAVTIHLQTAPADGILPEEIISNKFIS